MAVSDVAERNLEHEKTLIRKKFKPPVSVQDTMADDPSCSRKPLSSATKGKVKEEEWL